MDELRDLYQATILDHNKKPRNFHELPHADHTADGHNPICGDQLRVFAVIEDNLVKDVSFQGVGCAISLASASLMTEAVKGRSLDEITHTFESFHELVTGPSDTGIDTSELGKLAVFSGVREFPMRVKCATLAWHTLQAALNESPEVAKTE